jgi:hypothetical protein
LRAEIMVVVPHGARVRLAVVTHSPGSEMVSPVWPVMMREVRRAVAVMEALMTACPMLGEMPIVLPRAVRPVA